MGISDVKEGYERLTRYQKARDDEVLSCIQTKFVEPLAEELEVAIKEYESLSDVQKFLEIMRTNEDSAPNGCALPLDFGERAQGMVICKGLVFAGANLYETQTIHVFKGVEGTDYIASVEGVEWLGDPREDWIEERELWYSETFPRFGAGYFGTTRMGRLDQVPSDKLERVLEEASSTDIYKELPVSFKVAVVAQLICQNILVPYSDACRYAAGLDKKIEPRRRLISPLQSEYGPYGWLVAIRDKKPENKMLIDLARTLRHASPDSLELDVYNSVMGVEVAPPPPERKERSRRDRTETLVSFIDEILPARHKYVGRIGEGEHISFDKAKVMFDEEYPEFSYNSTRSFRNSYYNARKAREKE